MDARYLHALEQALLGFVWQGAVVALAVAGLLALMPQRAARMRYATACLGLVVMALLPVVTFLAALADATREATSGAFEALAQAGMLTVVASEGVILADVPWTETLRPWLLPAWCCGVLLLSARTVVAWVVTQRMTRRDTQAPAAPWREALTRALSRVRLSRPVRMLASTRVDVPMVMGLWRPLILVPAGAIAGLSPAQLEAVLAHELAHIRRHDYLVNLLQSLVETLLFYHPAVWWLSHRIREEREHCADDLAVQCCGDVVLYARALAMIEEQRFGATPHPALGVGGGALLARVRRLLSAAEPRSPRRPWRLASGLGGAGLAVALATSQVPETAHAEVPLGPTALQPEVRSEAAGMLSNTAPMHHLLVAPESFTSQARLEPSGPRTLTAPAPQKVQRTPPAKARPARVTGPLLIPDTGSIARTELSRVPYSLDGAPAALMVVDDTAAPDLDDALVNAASAHADEHANERPQVVVSAPAPARASAYDAIYKHMTAPPPLKRLRPGITPPRFLSGERIQFRNVAYGSQTSLDGFPKGAVVARCVITAEGSVTDCQPLKGLRGLEAGVIRTLSTWRYEPARLDGKPVAVRYVFDIWFTKEPGGGPRESKQVAGLDLSDVLGTTNTLDCDDCDAFVFHSPTATR
ncbi:Regulatory sensor-transducer, BlaR1/MecR1 family [Myxococcus hansupus]|uniref:Regulatory sensor-transducer, BlaR1/MecR1 family n=2 Tax=Pseudomyxococcus hansupus TaxID=1297742 RepID=A0A0H4WQE0_9BACT|nr:Regulatory sensor-transducer, BlaR1/MecR1 family [Myxococcus hansupus]